MTEELDDQSYPWVEEFRPKKIEDVIGADRVVEKMNEFIKTKSVPHLLLCGGPGVGKTTIAKIIANEVSGKGNYLYINASDRNNIDTIRTDVINYCGTLGFGAGLKIIILDECDGLLPASQKALRSVMEEYAKTTRFILTCNYDNKIIEPIQSRCQKFEFFGASKGDIAARCFDILRKKGVKITKENLEQIKTDLRQLVAQFYPDIRSVINNLQKFTKDGTFHYDGSATKDGIKKQFIEHIKNYQLKVIREELLKDFSDYPYLYDCIYNNCKEITTDPDKITAIYVLLADYVYKHSSHINQELNFIACLIEIINVLKG